MQQRAPGISLAAFLGEPAERPGPGLNHLLPQLDTLQQGEESPRALPPPMASPEDPVHDPKSSEDYVQRGMFYEQQGQNEQAISAYQRALEVDAENFTADVYLLLLLEKLNPDVEAVALWKNKISDMREALRRGYDLPAWVDEPFLMTVENVGEAGGQGREVSGQIERGVVRVGDRLQLVGSGAEQRIMMVNMLYIPGRGYYTYHGAGGERHGVARAGDKVSLFFRGLRKSQIKPGMVLATPASITPHTSSGQG